MIDLERLLYEAGQNTSRHDVAAVEAAVAISERLEVICGALNRIAQAEENIAELLLRGPHKAVL